MDISSFFDYMALGLFSANTDWLGNNERMWRHRSPEGRWRWFVVDFDLVGGRSTDPTYDPFSDRLHPDPEVGVRTPTWRIFWGMMEDPVLRAAFLERLDQLLGTSLHPDQTLSVLDELASSVAGEIARHELRWGFEGKEPWEDAVSRLGEFLTHRHEVTGAQVADALRLYDATAR